MNTNLIALKIALQDSHHLGRLRLQTGLEAARVEESVWMKGNMNETLLQQVRALPGVLCFHVLSDGQLIQFGCLVPSAQLPTADWVPIANWFEPQLPASSCPSRLPRPTSIRLKRGGSLGDANVLLCDLDEWHAYATTAPQVRLDRLYFACDAASRQVLVRGAPLPPVRGKYFVERKNVAIEAGWTLSPPVDERTVREKLNLGSNGLAIIKGDGTWEKIDESDFVKSRRSAVRTTYQKAPR